MVRPRVFFRKQTQSYYVKIGGKFVPLGKDEKEARAKCLELLPVESSTNTDNVRALASAYLDYLAANRSNNTYKIALRQLTAFADHLGDYFPVKDVKGFHLQQWADQRFKGKSDGYKRRAMCAIKCCWSWGTRLGYLPADNLRPVELPPPGQRETFIPIDQWRAIVDGAHNQPFKDYLTVALESGLRPQEVHQACVRHYKPEFGSLTFERKTSKGKKRRRVIPLNPASKAIVERLISQRSGPNDPIFLNTEGRPWCKDSVNCAMRRLRKKLDMPGLCATALRHSYAHARLVQGADPLSVSKAMGHADVRMIATRYGHLEQSLDYLKRGKALTVNPFLPPLETAGPESEPAPAV